MLGNDHLADCTVAGAMHCVMLWNKIAGRDVGFSNLDAQDDYFAMTRGKDTGVDMITQADYWRKTGFRDMTAQRHQIVAYVQVPNEPDYIDAACYWFDAVGLGVVVGDSEEWAFIHHLPWSAPGEGTEYHYVPMVGKNGYRKVVTWGGLQDIGPKWMESNVKEIVAMISREALLNGKSAEGFDMNALRTNLNELTA